MISAVVGILAQLSISVSAPEKIREGDVVIVTAVAQSVNLLPPEVTPPDFSGFTLHRTTASTRVRSSSSARYVVVEFQYHISTPFAGNYTIRPFTARLEGQTVVSQPLQIVVEGAPVLNAPPIVTRAYIDSTRPVSVATLGSPDTVFVGEQAIYSVAVFVDEVVLRQRSARNPTITPPDIRGTIAYDIPPQRTAIPSRVAGARRYRPHIYERAIFPLVPGRMVVPAATLDYTLPSAGAGIFRREESQTLRADSVVIVALPLPAGGRPDNFSGAVGRFSLSRVLPQRPVRVGDPFVVRIRVNGTGNIRLLPRPLMQLDWADAIPTAERLETRIENRRVTGFKEFDWIVTPKESGANELPELEYAYFDPARRTYQLATAPAEQFEILEAELVNTLDSALAPPSLPIRRQNRGEKGSPLHTNMLVVLLVAVAPIPAMSRWLRRIPRGWFGRMLQRTSGGEGGRTGRARQGTTDPSLATDNSEQLRRAFLSLAQSRTGVDAEDVTKPARFQRALLRAGVTRETTLEAVEVLAQLNAAVFGLGSTIAPPAEQVREVMRRIEVEAVNNSVGRKRRPLSLVLILSASLLQVEGVPLNHYDNGVTLYELGVFEEAALEFLSAAEDQKRSPDIWANVGAASWHAGDTAAAMLGWQRAIRLEPTAGDMRQNISRVGGDAAIPDWIPPVDAAAAAILACFLWIAGWSLLSGRVHVRRGAALVLGVAAVSAALAIGMLSIHVAGRITDPDISVVGRTVNSHLLPALSSEPVARLNAGEVVTTVERRGEWRRVILAGQPSGWTHNSFLLPVSID